MNGDALRGEQQPRRSVRVTGYSQDRVGGIEGAFDGEKGGVCEGDDERLRSGVDIVGGGIGDPEPGVKAHDRSSDSAWRMRVRTSRSTSFFFFRAAARKAAVAIRSVSRRELAAASCRMERASAEKMSLVAPTRARRVRR